MQCSITICVIHRQHEKPGSSVQMKVVTIQYCGEVYSNALCLTGTEQAVV